MRTNMPTSQKAIQGPFISDAQFDQFYPLSIRQLAKRHWTPLSIASRAAQFLAAEPNVKILDIGSGVGKFCLAAAYFQPKAYYFGIEQRQRLVRYSDNVKELLGLDNVEFIHGNLTQLNFADYDHFYFYNSFYENLIGSDRIDQSIDYSAGLFYYYNRYLYRLLDQKPAGTRLATFHSMEHEIPPDYHLVGEDKADLLKFWIKI